MIRVFTVTLGRDRLSVRRTGVDFSNGEHFHLRYVKHGTIYQHTLVASMSPTAYLGFAALLD